MVATLLGRLTVDPQGCFHIGTGPGSDVLWPRGFTARQPLSGPAEVVDPDGEVAARVGDIISTGGGYAPAAPQPPCTNDRPWHINSAITVISSKYPISQPGADAPATPRTTDPPPALHTAPTDSALPQHGAGPTDQVTASAPPVPTDTGVSSPRPSSIAGSTG
ncbi:hypothetical protein [Nakamurella endophytica]|uniref:Uncharacterized protein n=1 Tax=Nakamurella endophytica TaxID=1748367 RepID=A0A917TBX9_9ACTN|nr:hypothetical protein [Nakamurella endophytica]GGM17330.1 hypothetical protein GCM10011594_41740 [Nakamurella endophytica]